MGKEEQSGENFETKYKKRLFDEIDEVHLKQCELITQMTTNATNLGQSHVDIPNTATTLNNKIVQLIHIFREAGLSLFSAEYIDDVDGLSFLGDAIISDLINKMQESIDKLAMYGKTLEKVLEQKNERLLAFEKKGLIEKYLFWIKVLFSPEIAADLKLTKEELNAIESALREYVVIDNTIFKYNLEDNLVHALVKYIAGPQQFGEFNLPHKYDASVVPRLLENYIITDLKKLGLEHLIPKLQNALVEEYKKDLLYPFDSKNMYLFVPDFTSKKNKAYENDLGDFLQSYDNLNLKNQQKIEETMNILENNVYSLDDFEKLSNGR